MKKVSEIVGTMSKISNKTTLEDLKHGLNGVIGTIGNTLIVKFLFFSQGMGRLFRVVSELKNLMPHGLFDYFINML